MKISIQNRIALSKAMTMAAIVATTITTTLFSPSALALPTDFSGSYQILQSRTLGLTANGRGYVLQDGSLTNESSVDRARPYCRAGQSKFDEPNGSFEVTFTLAADGFQHAVLTTIPAVTGHRSTTIDCISELGFSGALDISVALGRVVELTK